MQTLRYPAHTPAISPARAGVGSEPLGSTTGRSPPSWHSLAWAGAKGFLSTAHLMGTLSEIGLVALMCPHASRVWAFHFCWKYCWGFPVWVNTFRTKHLPKYVFSLLKTEQNKTTTKNADKIAYSKEERLVLQRLLWVCLQNRWR